MAQLVHSTPQMVILPASSNPGVKDSRWLTLEVCREFQRSKCSRTDTECKFAHPPPHVEIQNGRVVACFDSIKGKCQRKDPPCKYLHPPQHLREQLLQNGRNNLILKNLHIQAYQTQYANIMPMAHPSSSQAPPQAVLRPPTMTPAVAAAVAAVAPSPYDAATHYPGLQTLSTVPGQAPPTAYSPYLTSYASVPMPGSADPSSVMSQMMPANMIAAKAVRADKFEVCREFQRGTCSRPASECRYAHPADHIVVDATDNHVTVCMDFVKSKCTRDQCKYFHPPSHLQALVRAAHARNQAAVSNNITNSCSTLTPSAAAMPHPMVIAKKRPRDPTDDLLLQSTVPGMMPAYKRIAVGDISKGGYPMYQANPMMSPLQHTSLMHLQQQPSYIPVSYTTYLYPHEAPHAAAPSAYSPHQLTAFNPATMFSMSPSIATTSAASSNLISSIMASTSMAGTTSCSSSGDPGLVPASGLSLYMMPKNSHSSSNVSSNMTTSAHGATHVPSIPNNAYHVEYFGSNKQLRDTLPVCQEFKSGLCDSPYCQLVHLSEDYVEETNNQVTVCRDFATRQTCRRSRCKYYHIPVDLPPS